MPDSPDNLPSVARQGAPVSPASPAPPACAGSPGGEAARDSRLATHDSRAAAAPPPRDPQLGGVTAAKAEAWARAHGKSVALGLKVLGAALERETQRRADDPFAFGYEPPSGSSPPPCWRGVP